MSSFAQLVREEGVPVLRTGQPMGCPSSMEHWAASAGNEST